jgi:VanZ family protein
MSHYYKLAFTTFRIIGSLIAIYSLLSSVYVLITARIASWAAATPVPDTLIVKFIPVFFYLLLGILVFAFSKQLARMAVKGIDRE